MKNLSNKMFDFKTGTYDYMGNKISSFGATVVIKRPSAHTHINFDDISEAVDTIKDHVSKYDAKAKVCLLYTSPSPRDQRGSRMPSSA